jgi:hypothetical protein
MMAQENPIELTEMHMKLQVHRSHALVKEYLLSNDSK